VNDRPAPNRRVTPTTDERRVAARAKLDRLDAAMARCQRAIDMLPAVVDDEPTSSLRGATAAQRAIYARVLAALTAPLDKPGA
jgi:hypothetical protein